MKNIYWKYYRSIIRSMFYLSCLAMPGAFLLYFLLNPVLATAIFCASIYVFRYYKLRVYLLAIEFAPKHFYDCLKRYKLEKPQKIVEAAEKRKKWKPFLRDFIEYEIRMYEQKLRGTVILGMLFGVFTSASIVLPVLSINPWAASVAFAVSFVLFMYYREEEMGCIAFMEDFQTKDEEIAYMTYVAFTNAGVYRPEDKW